MQTRMDRRTFLQALGACGLLAQIGGVLAAGDEAQSALIAAAWRGPQPGDTYHAGVLSADWQRRKLEIRHAFPLPTRPHGISPEPDGGLLVIGVRPGSWMLRSDSAGRIVRRVNLEDEAGSTRFNGHAIASPRGDVLYTTETDFRSGRGRIGVRDRESLKKLDEWDSHGIEPHQLLVDAEGHLLVANGGIPRTLADKKYDLQRMESSLVRLDGKRGEHLQQWTLDDPRLSLRHLAWSHSPRDGKTYLGVAMQAEHDDPARRAAAPILAVLDGGELRVPARMNDGAGYAGDIAAAYNGGFALSSNQAGLAQLWLPTAPERLVSIVEMQEAYALTSWPGPKPGGGVLVATAPGLIRWHPTAKPAFLAWPQPMALDNHWALIGEA